MDSSSKRRKGGKSARPLKILVNLFGRSNAASASNSSKAAKGDANAVDSPHSPPIVVHDDARSPVSLMSPTAGGGGGGGGVDSVSVAPSQAVITEAGEVLEVYTEMEALHLSRQDNPFIQRQVSCSQDNLDDLMREQSMTESFTRCGSQSVVSGCHSLASPDPLWPNSPTRSCDPLILEEVHAHLVRSPPPVNWPQHEALAERASFPLSPRSCGTFSPDSSQGDGLELDCANNNPTSTSSNYYVRSQSEEHILSPCRELLRSGMHGGGGGGAMSPNPSAGPITRGATPDPDFLLMTTSLHAGMGTGESGAGSLLPPTSPRTPMSATPTPRMATQQPHPQKIRRNHTLNLSSEFVLQSDSSSWVQSPFRSQTGGCDYGATSVSSYAMNNSSSNTGFPPSGAHHRRSLGGRPSKKLSAPASAGPAGPAEGFFASNSLKPGNGGPQAGRQRRRTSESQAVTTRQQDAKSMENLQGEQPSFRLMSSPSARKSVSSIGGGGPQMFPHSPRNSATLFTKWRVKDPAPLYIG